MEKFYLKEHYLAPIRLGLNLSIQYAKWRINKLKPEIEALIKA
jgi:hypothetical protein